MTKIIGIIKKLVKWVIAILPTLIGIIEATLKFIKELLTLIIDILFPIIPIEKFKIIILKIRDSVDFIYDKFSKIKEWLLKKIGL
jgi:phage-related protein